MIGDIELFARERAARAPDAPLVAITGTNGKSTTTALIAHILREAGRDVQLGGNIGVPVLDLEPPAPRPHPCPGMLDVPDRPRAVAEAQRRPAHQPDARPSRPPRHDGELRRDQGAAGRGVRCRAGRARRRSIAAPSPRGCRQQGRRRRRRSPPARSARADVFVDDHRLFVQRRRRRRRSISRRAARCAARTTARTPPSPSPPRARSASASSDIAERSRQLPRPRASHGAGREDRRDAVRQRFQGDQRRRGGEGAALVPRHLLDPRRQGEGGRHRAAAAAVSARAQGLSDRRRDRRFRRSLDGAVAYERCGTLDNARRRRRARRGGERRGGAGRAAVARLRVLRPIRQFRSARRRVPRAIVAQQLQGAMESHGRSHANADAVADWMRHVDPGCSAPSAA